MGARKISIFQISIWSGRRPLCYWRVYEVRPLLQINALKSFFSTRKTCFTISCVYTCHTLNRWQFHIVSKLLMRSLLRLYWPHLASQFPRLGGAKVLRWHCQLGNFWEYPLRLAISEKDRHPISILATWRFSWEITKSSLFSIPQVQRHHLSFYACLPGSSSSYSNKACLRNTSFLPASSQFPHKPYLSFPPRIRRRNHAYVPKAQTVQRSLESREKTGANDEGARHITISLQPCNSSAGRCETRSVRSCCYVIGRPVLREVPRFTLSAWFCHSYLVSLYAI